MRIGIVTTWFERGAAYVSKQFKEVWEQSNDVYIYARGGEFVAKSDANWNKGNITYGKRFNYSNLDLIDLEHFENWIKENELDVVFFNEQHLWAPVLLCNKLKVKTGSYIDYYTDETVLFFGVFDFLVCNTKRHRSVFHWHPNVFYIPWGTDVHVFNSSQRKIENPNYLTFFHSAGMNPYRKGTDSVVKAFKNIKDKSAKLVLHTQVNIFTFFPELKEAVQSLFNENRLEIIEKTVSAPGLYYLGDVYVYPTRLEGIGLTIAEASACGMPVITTNEPPMNEFVKEDINGKLIEVSAYKKRKDGYYWNESIIDLSSLTGHLDFYCENINSIEKYKDQSYNYAKTYLNWDVNSKKLFEIIEHVTNLPLADKNVIIREIEEYERNRGWKFYIANLKFYRIMKRKLFALYKQLVK
jgi:1,2-diacylglycerol 3-alpha-glucosyltransferase